MAGAHLSSQKKSDKKDRIICFLLLVIVLLLSAIIWAVFFRGHSDADGPEDPAIETVSSAPAADKLDGRIKIPGFANMVLHADTVKQNTVLQNPAENNCYFIISLILEDGTELWHSGLVAPGEYSDAITLTVPLSAGTYEDTVVRYDCFRLDDRTPLNSAETKLTLIAN